MSWNNTILSWNEMNLAEYCVLPIQWDFSYFNCSINRLVGSLHGCLIVIPMAEYVFQVQYSRSIWIQHNENIHVFQVCSADTQRMTMSPSLCRSRCRSSASRWERPSSVGRPTPSIPSPCSPPLSWPELQERRWVSDAVTSPFSFTSPLILLYLLHDLICTHVWGFYVCIH